MPMMFTICEAVKEWLLDRNTPDEADDSAYGSMMRRAQDAAKEKVKNEMEYEAQKKKDDISAAEKEEAEVLRRRKEGTQCTKETFQVWKVKWDAEQEEKRLPQEAAGAKKGGPKVNLGSGAAGQKERLTGFQIFSSKAGVSMDDIEKTSDAFNAERGEELERGEGIEIDETLFDGDDDLDFSDDDDDDDDDDDNDDDDGGGSGD